MSLVILDFLPAASAARGSRECARIGERARLLPPVLGVRSEEPSRRLSAIESVPARPNAGGADDVGVAAIRTLGRVYGTTRPCRQLHDLEPRKDY